MANKKLQYNSTYYNIPPEAQKMIDKITSKYSILSEEEQIELVKRIQKNPKDKEAREKLIGSNIKFIVMVVNQYNKLANEKIPYIEKLIAGVIGLLKAAEKYDTTSHVKFLSYAVHWIRQSIEQLISEELDVLRIPTNKRAIYRKFLRRLKENNQDFNKTLEEEEFKDVRDDILRIHSEKNIQSMENPISRDEDDNQLRLLEVISIPPEQEDIAILNEIRETIDKLLSEVLDVRERRIIELYYGLNTPQSYTLEQIAKELSLSKERVRQLKKRALRKLFDALNGKYGYEGNISENRE